VLPTESDSPAVSPDAASSREVRNLLLRELPDAEWARIEPHLERVTLPRHLVLYDPERPISHVHFVDDGIASILSIMRDGSAIEAATLGYDAMIGMAVFHGMDIAPEQAVIQVSGAGHRLPSETFRTLLPDLPTLASRLLRLSAAMFSLAAQNSGCNRKHSIEQRCARWLLMVDQRVSRARFDLTHHFISQMLGVRRASVTGALGALETSGLIVTSRGQIAILDRAGLEQRACECHEIISVAFARALGNPNAVTPLLAMRLSTDGETTVGDGTPGPGADTDMIPEA